MPHRSHLIHNFVWSFTSWRHWRQICNNIFGCLNNAAYRPPCRGITSGDHMSKRDKAGKKSSSQGKHGKNTPCATETSAATILPVPVTRDKTGAVTVSVHAKPGSKQNAITDVSAEAVGVAIAAAPTDGEANAELLRYLAQVLQLKKSQVTLDKGSRSRNKIVTVGTSLSPEEVLDRLRQAAD
ncbi:unnamed protein product [Lota lota]